MQQNCLILLRFATIVYYITGAESKRLWKFCFIRQTLAFQSKIGGTQTKVTGMCSIANERELERQDVQKGITITKNTKIMQERDGQKCCHER